LRGLSRWSERDLLSGRVAAGAFGVRRRSTIPIASAVVLVAAGAALVAGATMRAIGQAEAFFGAGTALLAAGLCAITVVLRRPPRSIAAPCWPALLPSRRGAT